MISVQQFKEMLEEATLNRGRVGVRMCEDLPDVVMFELVVRMQVYPLTIPKVFFSDFKQEQEQKASEQQ